MKSRDNSFFLCILNVGSRDDESSHYEPRQLGGTDGDRALPLVGNEAQFSEAIHKKTDSGSGCANHFRQLFLMDFRNDRLRLCNSDGPHMRALHTHRQMI
jgi:hypothetical protein